MEIRRITPADAASLIRCFRTCYGDSYANPLFYRENDLEAAIASGRLRSVVAIDDGDIVGHTGLNVTHPDALVAEAGNTVVDPRMRGRGVLAQMGEQLAALTTAEGFVGYVHFPTTAHEIMQKRATSGTGRETGIMLAYVPAETDYRDFDSAGGRVAATVVYQPFVPSPPARIHTPGAYLARISRFASDLDLSREHVPGSPAQSDASTFTVYHQRDRGLCRVEVDEIGADIRQVVEAAPASGVMHVDLPMDDPACPEASLALTETGFAYCAWLPGYARGDVLRLQRIEKLTAAEASPDLVTAAAGQILDEILTEIRRPT